MVQWEKAYGRPCPRVELDERNREAAALALRFADRLIVGDSALGHLLDDIISGLVSAISIRFDSTWRAKGLFDRALGALSHETVTPAINARIQEQRDRQEEALARGKSATRRPR